MATQYAEIADFEKFGLGPKGLVSVNSADITAALLSASSVADGYLHARYGDQLPLTTWPEALRVAVCKIAAFELLAGVIGFNAEGSHDNFLERHRQAMAWLRDVAQGRVTFPVTAAAPARYETPMVVSDDSRGF
jgi:phage gp36-like protein